MDMASGSIMLSIKKHSCKMHAQHGDLCIILCKVGLSRGEKNAIVCPGD